MASNDDLIGMRAETGLQNVKYGVWKSGCCGEEVVVYPGSIFPMCNKHRDRPTEWILISTNLLGETREIHERNPIIDIRKPPKS